MSPFYVNMNVALTTYCSCSSVQRLEQYLTWRFTTWLMVFFFLSAGFCQSFIVTAVEIIIVLVLLP